MLRCFRLMSSFRLSRSHNVANCPQVHNVEGQLMYLHVPISDTEGRFPPAAND